MKRLLPFVDNSRIYCNASITRPYIDYKSRKYSEKAFENLKRIWEGRNIVFVEGANTKLGMGNDLFDNAKAIRRIVCPSQNAFSKIDEIEKAIEKYVNKEELILTALGPTASILATDMCKKGYQIVDIGHVDIEYIWYQKKSILREQVEGKHVNESGQKECSDFYGNNDAYLKSILVKIS